LKKKIILLSILLLTVFVFSSCVKTETYNPIPPQGGDVLFDNAHSQTAGNADWTITGGFSDFADDLKNLGYSVAQWGDDEDRSEPDDDAPITYNVLEKYKVYVIPEPNTPFTSSERQDVIRYIYDGGSVFFISDHAGADRNSNGWDAVEIFNGFKKGVHSIETNLLYSDDFVGKLGFRFREVSYSQHPITSIVSTSITAGVNEVGEWSGSTEYIINKNKVHGIVYLDNKDYGPYVIYGTYGKGKFVAIGDSSPIDDGNGAPHNKLYDGYNDFDDAQLCKNIINWLALK
jgi:hypothetical protein